MKKKPDILSFFGEGATPGHVNATYLKAPELYNYAQALEQFIDKLQSTVIPRIKPSNLKDLSQVNLEDALSIIKAGYNSFFEYPAQKGKWKLVDDSEALGEDCKVLSASNKAYDFTFYTDKISVGLTEPDASISFDDVNYDCHFGCYLHAYAIGYYIPGLTEIIEEMLEAQNEDDESSLDDYDNEEIIAHMYEQGFTCVDTNHPLVDLIESWSETLDEKMCMDKVCEFLKEHSAAKLLEILDNYKL